MRDRYQQFSVAPRVPGVETSRKVMVPIQQSEAVQQDLSRLFPNRPHVDEEKARNYPLMVMSEVCPHIKLEWVAGYGRSDRQFKVEAEVQGRKFFGEGRSKKVAKLNLAKTILFCMYNISDFKESDATVKFPRAEEIRFEKRFPIIQLKELLGESSFHVEVERLKSIEDGRKAFIAKILVNDVTYEAIGKSKNISKILAAKRALEALRTDKREMNGIKSEREREIDTSRHPAISFYRLFRDVKFITESKLSNGGTVYNIAAEVHGKLFTAMASSKKKAKLKVILYVFENLFHIPFTEWKSIDCKNIVADNPMGANSWLNNPIMLLLKLNPHARFDVTEDIKCSPSYKYNAIARVGDGEFQGDGPNKRLAKNAAARSALLNKYGIDPDNYSKENRVNHFATFETENELPTALCDNIAQAVQKKLYAIFENETQHKVVSAFVLAKYDHPETEPKFKVVSIGTGTKCITGEQLDEKGETLNDCHGEVIAARGFRQFLFDELLLSVQCRSETIFEKNVNGKLSLKDEFKLYLFVNTAPCGDGRVFALKPLQQNTRNKTLGMLRTKIENGQGTIPVPQNSVQTADGILEGERLRTMSCSDKILKWNVLGVQGALLSYFINPVYINGVVIDLHYNYRALCRALYERATSVTNLPASYRMNKPLIGTPSKCEHNKDTLKATSNSFNWYHRKDTLEAVNAISGKTVVLTPSRLCKLQFFDNFLQVIWVGNPNVTPKTYHHAKQLATEYQHSKMLLFRALSEAAYGKWIGKPYEHDMFGY